AGATRGLPIAERPATGGLRSSWDDTRGWTEDDPVPSAALAVIRTLRDRVRHVSGCLVASVDGRLIAHDTHAVEPDGMAALSAAVLGLSQRLVMTVEHDQFAETVTRGTRGYVATYAAGPHAVLTVIAAPEANVGRLHLESRRVAMRIAHLLGPAGTR
ncbi:MAG TPA: roadblock/LC7 domain-containing protein, partial [Streptomyces sp.]|nr:roadblock/LC7 domain-containing protein [Streptomyces sp.]